MPSPRRCGTTRPSGYSRLAPRSASRSGWRMRSTEFPYRCTRGRNVFTAKPGCRSINTACSASARTPKGGTSEGNPNEHGPAFEVARWSMTLARRLRDYFSPREFIDTSPRISDEVKYMTCYMCACRCGIKVHLKDGAIRYIEGTRDHPVNRGVICGKGASGIMQQHSPAKLRKPLKRVGERGSGEFREIEWEEALATAVGWLSAIRSDDPKKLAFFTGRDQSQSLTGYWAAQFGTPNFAAHGGFCSVNMAAAGMYTLGSSFWEFGEPDWLHTRFFMMFGVAEDHDSNPIKIGLSGLRRRGAKFVSVNPVRTGYSAIADEWVGIRPGTDAFLVLSLIHELLKADRIDIDYLGRYTNAGWLVIQAPGAADDGLFARSEAGEPFVLQPSGSLASGMAAGITARLVGET